MSDDHKRPRAFELVAVWLGLAAFSLAVWGVFLWSILRLTT